MVPERTVVTIYTVDKDIGVQSDFGCTLGQMGPNVFYMVLQLGAGKGPARQTVGPKGQVGYGRRARVDQQSWGCLPFWF